MQCLREIQREEPEALSNAHQADRQVSLASHQYNKKNHQQ
jgi:hypothetical protein